MSKLGKYVVPGIILLSALFPGNGEAVNAGGGENALNGSAGPGSSVRQEPKADTEQNEYGAILDRMGREKQKGYLASLRRINADLRNGYAAIAKNYTAYRANYQRIRQDMDNRRATPSYVLKKMQELDAEREKTEADMRTREAEKKALETEASTFYKGAVPRELAEEWKKEEEEYAGYLNSVYRQVGWWMQIEDSRQWQNDESQLWDYLRQYYRDHPGEMDILK